jgi:hypothetical protein
LLADAERLYAKGTIDTVLVVAPNGVHLNWVNREIPAHMEGNIVARAWRSGAGVRHMKSLEELFRPRREGESVPLRFLAVNIDALVTKKGYEFCERFLLSGNALILLDESSRIKNPDAARKSAHAAATLLQGRSHRLRHPGDQLAGGRIRSNGVLGKWLVGHDQLPRVRFRIR